MTDFSTIKKLFHITENNGFDDNEIKSIKAIFGELPEVLTDYYRELGKVESLNKTQDFLVLPQNFHSFENDEYLIFYAENQVACVWGIHKDDLSKTNPPVYMSYDEKNWEPETNTLLDFLTAMAYLQAGFALQFCSEAFYELEKEGLDYIDKNFKKRNVSFQQWADGISFYGNHDDEVIIIMSGNQLFYSSANEAYFSKMDKVLPTLGIML